MTISVFIKTKEFINKQISIMFRKILILLSVAASMFSCNDLDPQPVRSKYYEKDMELNEKYFDKVCGEWYNEKTSETERVYESLSLTSDNKCVFTVKSESREIVKINGTDTYTDWETQLDETQTGTWKLCYSDLDEGLEPYLSLNIRNQSDYILAQYCLFNGVDEDNLFVRLLFFDSLKRGHSEPSF